MKNIIIFSDFDGTITTTDTLDYIITDVYSFEVYKEIENKLFMKEITYEMYLHTMFENLKYDIRKLNYELVDKNFEDFYNFIKSENIDFYIVSSGFKRLICYLLPYVNNDIIYSNDINITDDNKWKIKLYYNDKQLSINKNNILNEKKQDNTVIYIGDGISDFDVINNVDVLFVKKGSHLHNKCIECSCKYILFDDFKEIKKQIKRIIDS